MKSASNYNEEEQKQARDQRPLLHFHDHDDTSQRTAQGIASNALPPLLAGQSLGNFSASNIAANRIAEFRNIERTRLAQIVHVGAPVAIDPSCQCANQSQEALRDRDLLARQ